MAPTDIYIDTVFMFDFTMLQIVWDLQILVLWEHLADKRQMRFMMRFYLGGKHRHIPDENTNALH